MSDTSAVTRYQYVTAVFGDADVDLAIDHTLDPDLPDFVCYEVVQADRACRLYHDATYARRAWTPTQVFLRSDTADARVVLRLSLPANPPPVLLS